MMSRLFLVLAVTILAVLHMGTTFGLIVGGIAAAVTAGMWFHETRDRYRADVEAFTCLVDGDVENITPYYKNIIKGLAPNKRM